MKTSADPYIAFREVDRQISDFDRREHELADQMKALLRRVQDSELAKTNVDLKQIASDLVELKKTAAALKPLLDEANKQRRTLQGKISSMPLQVERVVKEKVERDHSDKHPRVQALMMIKLKSEAEKRLRASMKVYQTRLDQISVKAGDLSSYFTDIVKRISVLERVKEAKIKQARNPTDPTAIKQKVLELEKQKQELQQERSQFNRNEGTSGQKSKMRLQSQLIDQVNDVLRKTGFIDLLSPIEKVAKGLTDIEGTERTFISKVAMADRLKLMEGVSPQDLIRSKVIDGDASPELNAEIDKISDNLAGLVDKANKLAEYWWKTPQAGNKHIEQLHGVLVTKFKYRFRRIFKEDLDAWIKKNIAAV
jgi:hypothetical protein